MFLIFFKSKTLVSTIFDNTKDIYNTALKNSGFQNKLEFSQDKKKTKNRNRKRKVTWYNPPFCKTINLNLGEIFINLIDKHFNSDNPLHKIFNRNTIKISYSCTNNMNKIINTHNKKILNNTCPVNANSPKNKMCNCRKKTDCPLEKQCQKENIIYKAEIYPSDDPEQKKFYIGASGTTFKTRFGNHKKSFNNYIYRHDTALSKYYW